MYYNEDNNEKGYWVQNGPYDYEFKPAVKNSLEKSDNIIHVDFQKNQQQDINRFKTAENGPFDFLCEPINKSTNTSKIDVSQYAKIVKACWGACLAKENNTLDDTQIITGQSFSWQSIKFDSQKLIEHNKEIRELLRAVSNAKTFEELGTLNSGETWTKTHFYLNMLLTMATALNLVDINKEDNKKTLLIRIK